MPSLPCVCQSTASYGVDWQTVRERGSMAIEVVILVPVLVTVMMLVVALGRHVDTRGQVEAVARDAVRAASLERDEISAQLAAQAIADQTLPDGTSCDPVQLFGRDIETALLFAADEMITVSLTCHVSFHDLGLIGLPGSAPVSGTSTAPLDQWRRAG